MWCLLLADLVAYQTPVKPDSGCLSAVLGIEGTVFSGRGERGQINEVYCRDQMQEPRWNNLRPEVEYYVVTPRCEKVRSTEYLETGDKVKTVGNKIED